MDYLINLFKFSSSKVEDFEKNTYKAYNLMKKLYILFMLFSSYIFHFQLIYSFMLIASAFVTLISVVKHIAQKLESKETSTST